MKASKLQHRVTRTRVKGSKLLEFGCLHRPLWIRRVLVGPERPPAAHPKQVAFGSSPGGQLKSAGEPTCVSRPADFLLVCSSSVPTPVQNPAAHQQAQPQFWRVSS